MAEHSTLLRNASMRRVPFTDFARPGSNQFLSWLASNGVQNLDAIEIADFGEMGASDFVRTIMQPPLRLISHQISEIGYNAWFTTFLYCEILLPTPDPIASLSLHRPRIEGEEIDPGRARSDFGSKQALDWFGGHS